MTTLRLELPESLHRMLVALAESMGVSVNQLVASAAGEKVSALAAETLAERAARGRLQRFEAALAKVPEASEREADELPAGYLERRAKKLGGSRGKDPDGRKRRSGNQ